MNRIRQILKVTMTATMMALGATVAVADGSKIFVIGGKADDPFWSKVKKGADDAGLVVQATGGSVTWLGPQNYDNLGPDAAKLIRTALSQNPSAIVGPDWVPEAMDDAFKAAQEGRKTIAEEIDYLAKERELPVVVTAAGAGGMPQNTGERVENASRMVDTALARCSVFELSPATRASLDQVATLTIPKWQRSRLLLALTLCTPEFALA